MTAKTAEVLTTGIRELLRLDHRRLATMSGALLEALRAGDTAELRSTWARFEAGLAGHMAAEDRYVLPCFGPAHPAEADGIAQQHAAFRRLLGELGTGIDLHLVKLDMAEDLDTALRDHAALEEAVLCPWLEREVDAPARHRIEDEVRSRSAPVDPGIPHSAETETTRGATAE